MARYFPGFNARSYNLASLVNPNTFYFYTDAGLEIYASARSPTVAGSLSRMANRANSRTTRAVGSLGAGPSPLPASHIPLLKPDHLQNSLLSERVDGAAQLKRYRLAERCNLVRIKEGR